MNVTYSQILERNADFLAKYRFNHAEFNENLNAFTRKEPSFINPTIQKTILSPPPYSFNYLADLDKFESSGRNAVLSGKVAAVILNGGMATRFGGGVKGLVPVVGKTSFLKAKLDLIHSYGEIPTFIMNSFATESDTCRFIKAYLNESLVTCFNQSVTIRITPDSKIYTDSNGNPSFCAPGHGDFFNSFKASSAMQIIKESDIEWIMISNVDNIFATLDTRLLGFALDAYRTRKTNMLVEVVEPLPNDAGGAPVLCDNKLHLLEGFRFPKGFDFSQLPAFNTNTFWIHKSVFEKNIMLSCYPVKKEINETPVIQFEQILGELTIEIPSEYIIVPRSGKDSRFLPIKTKEDLLTYENELFEHVI